MARSSPAATVDTTPAEASGLATKRQLTPAELKQRQGAAVKHGLYVRSEPGRRQRQYRAGRLLTRLLEAFADRGRPLTALQVPMARAWCQFETLASDAYAAVAAGGGEKAIQAYLAIRRGQLPYAVALGLSPAAETALARDLAATLREQNALKAQKDLNDRYGKQPRNGEAP